MANYPNSEVFLTDVGAQFHTPEGAGGTQLGSDLYLPMEFTQPTGSNSWIVTWDVNWGVAFNEAVSQLNTWNGAKIMRFLAADGTDNNETFWKHEITFSPALTSPKFAYTWSQVSPIFVGPDYTDNEPVSPSNYGAFPIRTGTWTRHWVQFTEGLPVGGPNGTVTVWMADEDRGAVRVLGPLSIRLPWNPTTNKGVKTLQLRFSAKTRQNGGPAVDFWMRNVMVLKNADIQSLLVKPVG